MEKSKKKILIPVIIIGILLIIVGACILNPTVNSALSNLKENISIDIEKKNYGYSKKEIENKIANSEIVYEAYEIYKVEDKLTIEPNDDFEDEEFSSVESFTYYGEIVYSVKNDTVKSVTVNPNTFTIVIVVDKPEVSITVDDDQINYLDSNLGLLSIRDLSLSDENLQKVKDYGENKLLDNLNNETNMNTALNAEKDLYISIYSSILKDIEGINMFTIKVEFEGN